MNIRDLDKLKDYVYRGLHICFCQGRDKNAKQEDYVDGWSEAIMKRVNNLLSQSRQEIIKEIDLMWDKKETDKNRYSVGWNSALAELEARLKLTQPRQSNNLNK
jgi:hypothetical protein